MNEETNDKSYSMYLEEKANDLLRMARKKGLDNNYLFTTAFNRYLDQLKMLKDLQDSYKGCDSVVTKEYVKGRETITAHPLISKINSTIDSANKTASLLVKMISTKELENSIDEINNAELFLMDDEEVIETLSPSTNIKTLSKAKLSQLANELRKNYEQQHEFGL